MKRIYFIQIFFLLFLVAISLRLFYWQVVKAEELSAQADQQHFGSIKIGAVRGDILYSDGYILASSTPIFSLFAQPKMVSHEDKNKIAYALAQIFWEAENQIPADKQTRREQIDTLKMSLLEKLNQDLYWVSLRRNIPLELKKKIEDLGFKGIGFDQLSGRFYPEGSSSAHLLGFVGSNARGESTGYFGLEGFYDGELKATGGLIRHERDALGLPILTGRFLTTNARNGKTLKLYLDRTVQFIAEKALKEGVVKYGARAGLIVVMDPKSGGVLAAASFPNYDPLKFSDFPKEYYKNPAVADLYEPGSTFKVLVMAAAINEKAIDVNTKCDICSGPIQIANYSIRTWNNKYQPNANMKDVIVHSDNTGMVFIAGKLGLDKFYEYVTNFGFGKKTGIDLQDEALSAVRPKNEWREIDLATASFGQGIALTPIQMVTAVSSIANGGRLMEPHVVKEIIEEDKKFEVKPKLIREVVTPETAKVVTEMMVAAVEEGEAKAFKPKGFKVAGKTGTAQIPVAGHYDPNKTIASFVGFAPADDPKFVILVRYDQPSSSIFGSETAAPTFFKIAKELFTYYKIAPSE